MIHTLELVHHTMDVLSSVGKSGWLGDGFSDGWLGSKKSKN